MKLLATDYKKLKHRKRIKSENRYQAHLKFLANYCDYYPAAALPRDKKGNNLWWSGNKENIAYYKRFYRGSHKGNRYWFYKKYSNRVVRRKKGEIHKGNSYKKCFDYWWTVD